MTKKFGKLYLDTNILRQFDFDIHKDPRYTNLKLKAKLLLSGICIPWIVFEEWYVFYKEVLNGNLLGLKSKVDNINKYVDSTFNLSLPDTNILEKELFHKMKENLKCAGIEIFANPFDSIKLNTIVEMAIHKIKPFTEQGKGFKDAIILFSIIEHCKYDIESEHFFLTGNKEDFDSEDIKNLIRKEKIDLKLIFSIDDLNKYLTNLMSKKLKEWIDKRNGSLKELLLAQKDKVVDFIRQRGEFSSRFLRRDLPLGMYVDRIIDFNFLDIIDPVVGFLDEGTDEGDVVFSFRAKIIFLLQVTELNFMSRRLKIGESSVREIIPLSSPFSSKTVKTEKHITIKGKIHIKRVNGEERFLQETIELWEVIGEEPYLSRSSILQALENLGSL